MPSEGGTCLPVEPDEVVQVEEVALVAEVPPCHAECGSHPAEVISAALKLPSYSLSLPKACYYR